MNGYCLLDCGNHMLLFLMHGFYRASQPAFICSELPMEKPEQCVKSANAA